MAAGGGGGGDKQAATTNPMWTRDDIAAARKQGVNERPSGTQWGWNRRRRRRRHEKVKKMHFYIISKKFLAPRPTDQPVYKGVVENCCQQQ